MPFFSFAKSGLPTSPVLSLRDGTVQGKRLVDEENFKADAFLGIPYAQPPIGDLRFRKPIAPNKWTGTRKCVEHPPRCIQMPFSGSIRTCYQDWPMSEDCLYLNVFCPGDYPKEKKYPVMAYFHGGRYTIGGIKAYGDQGICEGLVREGVIVVNIQYRLGVLGFFSTGDEVCPGNFGLWDQVEALKWIQDNIEHFGGDKDNVTVFGQSAGGASAHLLTLSPHAKGLFHRIIPMSGNAHTPRALRPAITEYKEYTEEKLGIKAECSQELIDKLRHIPAEKLAVEIVPMRVPYKGFCPVIDGDLLPLPIDELAKTAPPIPMMVGVTSLESGLIIPNENYNIDTLEKAIEGLLPQNTPNAMKGRKELLEIYVDFARKKQPKEEMWRAMSEIGADEMFNLSTVKTIRDCHDRGIPTYFYVFDYYNPKCMGALADTTPSKDPCHNADLPFVFNSGIAAPFTFCDHDKQIAGMTIKAFANYAKTGNPNSEGEEAWLPCDKEHPFRNFVIDLKPRMEEEFMEGRCEKLYDLKNASE